MPAIILVVKLTSVSLQATDKNTKTPHLNYLYLLIYNKTVLTLKVCCSIWQQDVNKMGRGDQTAIFRCPRAHLWCLQQ